MTDNQERENFYYCSYVHQRFIYFCWIDENTYWFLAYLIVLCLKTYGLAMSKVAEKTGHPGFYSRSKFR